MWLGVRLHLRPITSDFVEACGYAGRWAHSGTRFETARGATIISNERARNKDQPIESHAASEAFFSPS